MSSLEQGRGETGVSVARLEQGDVGGEEGGGGGGESETGGGGGGGVTPTDGVPAHAVG